MYFLTVFAKCLILFGLLLSLSHCKTLVPVEPESSKVKDASFENSQYLVEAGERAKAYFYKLIQERSDFAKKNNLGIEFVVMDARDPRLYARGAPIQPPTPAEKALVKVARNGQFMILALFQDQPGFLKVKEFQDGNLVAEIVFGVEKITYSSRFDGLFASVTRFTEGQGWRYVYYARGQGNDVNPAQFDTRVAAFLQNTVMYITPVGR
jgi:hypothetical protein